MLTHAKNETCLNSDAIWTHVLKAVKETFKCADAQVSCVIIFRLTCLIESWCVQKPEAGNLVKVRQTIRL